MARNIIAPLRDKLFRQIPVWCIAVPLYAWVMFAWHGTADSSILFVLQTAGLLGSVMAAVHQAEVIAHRVGEPFGTIVLAIAVTLIEIALIASLMHSGGAEATALARDTVFATVMIILNGIIGLCLIVGGIRHREQSFGLEGVSASLTTLTAITILTLILPNYTLTVPGPYYGTSQLIFIATVSFLLYGTFLFVQTVRHRDYFLPDGKGQEKDRHAPPPTLFITLISAVLLLISLAIIVLLAKTLSPVIEDGVIRSGAPKALVGIIIAAVVLLPEGIAAVRAAQKNRLQTSLNLAIGSALATIGLTIPAVAVISIYTQMPLTLGIDVRSTVLLFLSLFITSIALRTGRTTVMQGAVLLVIFAVYLFITIVP
jgi:Ca2+:H+ antiporter